MNQIDPTVLAELMRLQQKETDFKLRQMRGYVDALPVPTEFPALPPGIDPQAAATNEQVFKAMYTYAQQMSVQSELAASIQARKIVSGWNASKEAEALAADPEINRLSGLARDLALMDRYDLIQERKQFEERFKPVESTPLAPAPVAPLPEAPAPQSAIEQVVSLQPRVVPDPEMARQTFEGSGGFNPESNPELEAVERELADLPNKYRNPNRDSTAKMLDERKLLMARKAKLQGFSDPNQLFLNEMGFSTGSAK